MYFQEQSKQERWASSLEGQLVDLAGPLKQPCQTAISTMMKMFCISAVDNSSHWPRVAIEMWPVA